jgi:hypothetical protein
VRNASWRGVRLLSAGARRLPAEHAARLQEIAAASHRSVDVIAAADGAFSKSYGAAGALKAIRR